MTTSFPDHPDFTGFNEPMRMECDIYDLVIEGEVPEEFNGSWYRSVPDPQYPPLLGFDTQISGDGMVSLFRFEKGHVDFKMRYVMTERFYVCVSTAISVFTELAMKHCSCAA